MLAYVCILRTNFLYHFPIPFTYVCIPALWMFRKVYVGHVRVQSSNEWIILTNQKIKGMCKISVRLCTWYAMIPIIFYPLQTDWSDFDYPFAVSVNMQYWEAGYLCFWKMYFHKAGIYKFKLGGSITQKIYERFS